MKSFIRKIIFLLFVAAAVYAAICAYMPVRKGMMGVVADKRSGSVVSVAAEERRFIWYGAFFWRYAVEIQPKQRSAVYQVHVVIPSLALLKGDFYNINIPVRIGYSIDPASMVNTSLLKDGAVALENSVKAETEAEFGTVLREYFDPVYRGRDALQNRDLILKEASASLSQRLKSQGIILDILQYSGSPFFPDNDVYNEGVKYLAELRRLSLDNEKKLIDTKNQLERDARLKERLYAEYREMSRIIRENPDILKYIYIDKFAANLKVIISSDKNAVPLFLEENKDNAKKSETGEIDNLR
jgi:hypothetical protein